MHEVQTIAERVAANQSAFRSANENIEAAAAGMDPSLDPAPFICECCDRECTEIARLTLEEYETVRGRSTWFFVVLGHETTHVNGVEIAEVARRHDRFTVMDKVGLAGDLAEALDPRSDDV
jgi:hypothetical protein